MWEYKRELIEFTNVDWKDINVVMNDSHLGILETFTERIYIDKSIKLNRKFVPLTHEPPNSSFI